MELTDIAAELYVAEKEKNIASVVRGRKNYMLRTEYRDDGSYIAYAGTQKSLKDRSLSWAYLSDMVKYHIRWFYFTYKKDLDKAVDILSENGIEIVWV